MSCSSNKPAKCIWIWCMLALCKCAFVHVGWFVVFLVSLRTLWRKLNSATVAWSFSNCTAGFVIWQNTGRKNRFRSTKKALNLGRYKDCSFHANTWLDWKPLTHTALLEVLNVGAQLIVEEQDLGYDMSLLKLLAVNDSSTSHVEPCSDLPCFNGAGDIYHCYDDTLKHSFYGRN